MREVFPAGSEAVNVDNLVPKTLKTYSMVLVLKVDWKTQKSSTGATNLG